MCTTTFAITLLCGDNVVIDVSFALYNLTQGFKFINFWHRHIKNADIMN